VTAALHQQLFILTPTTYPDGVNLFGLQVIIPTDLGFWWLVIVLLVIALIAILFIGVLFAFPVAALAAIAVYFFTGSLLWAGITFLVVALISVAIGDLMHMSRRHRHVVVEHVEEHVE
jgi:membrane protein implicated in regulation of membrane protease activity